MGPLAPWSISLGLAVLGLVVLVAAGCGGKGGKGGESGQGLVTKAEACHAEGRYDCAMESYGALLKARPRDPELLNRFAMVARLRYYVTGEADYRDQELDAFRRAARLAPEAAHIQVNLGTTLWEMGMQEEAAEAYAVALKRQPGHPDAAILRERIGAVEKGKEGEGEGKGEEKGEGPAGGKARPGAQGSLGVKSAKERPRESEASEKESMAAGKAPARPAKDVPPAADSGKAGTP